jgi:hypothetical protein
MLKPGVTLNQVAAPDTGLDTKSSHRSDMISLIKSTTKLNYV